jgi:hypothetical protein
MLSLFIRGVVIKEGDIPEMNGPSNRAVTHREGGLPLEGR